jgi:hypothetical protein
MSGADWYAGLCRVLQLLSASDHSDAEQSLIFPLSPTPANRQVAISDSAHGRTVRSPEMIQAFFERPELTEHPPAI